MVPSINELILVCALLTRSSKAVASCNCNDDAVKSSSTAFILFSSAAALAVPKIIFSKVSNLSVTLPYLLLVCNNRSVAFSNAVVVSMKRSIEKVVKSFTLVSTPTLSKDELNFILVNEIREIIDFTNAFLLKQTPIGTFNVEAISDLAIIDRTAPLVTFIEKIVNHKDHNQPKDIINIDIQDFAKKNKLTKNKNLPNILILIPIHSPQKGHQGFVAINKESEINDSEIELLKHLSGTFGHAFNSFISTFPIKESIKKYFSGKNKWKTIVIILLIIFFPVSMTTTAPVEVVAKNPSLITAPFNGVIKKIIVNNNDTVESGDLLAVLEDNDLINQYNLAKQTLQVAEKELLRTRQSSFSDNTEKSKLAELQSQVLLKKAEMNYANEKLEMTKIVSSINGVAIVENTLDWQGKPVNVGEKIMTIADPNLVEFLIWLPVKDSIIINNKAKVKIFLDINPINSLKGKVLRASYKPYLSPSEVLSYKLVASFDENQEIPRLGLRGTAKIYGSRVTLFYYLFRKPITYMRQFIGI